MVNFGDPDAATLARVASDVDALIETEPSLHVALRGEIAAHAKLVEHWTTERQRIAARWSSKVLSEVDAACAGTSELACWDRLFGTGANATLARIEQAIALPYHPLVQRILKVFGSSPLDDLKEAWLGFADLARRVPRRLALLYASRAVVAFRILEVEQGVCPRMDDLLVPPLSTFFAAKRLGGALGVEPIGEGAYKVYPPGVLAMPEEFEDGVALLLCRDYVHDIRFVKTG